MATTTSNKLLGLLPALTALSTPVFSLIPPVLKSFAASSATEDESTDKFVHAVSSFVAGRMQQIRSLQESVRPAQGGRRITEEYCRDQTIAVGVRDVTPAGRV